MPQSLNPKPARNSCCTCSRKRAHKKKKTQTLTQRSQHEGSHIRQSRHSLEVCEARTTTSPRTTGTYAGGSGSVVEVVCSIHTTTSLYAYTYVSKYVIYVGMYVGLPACLPACLPARLTVCMSACLHACKTMQDCQPTTTYPSPPCRM